MKCQLPGVAEREFHVEVVPAHEHVAVEPYLEDGVGLHRPTHAGHALHRVAARLARWDDLQAAWPLDQLQQQQQHTVHVAVSAAWPLDQLQQQQNIQSI